MNMFILYKLLIQLNKLLATYPSYQEEFKISGAGCLFYLFKKIFKLIDRQVISYMTSFKLAQLGAMSLTL